MIIMSDLEYYVLHPNPPSYFDQTQNYKPLPYHTSPKTEPPPTGTTNRRETCSQRHTKKKARRKRFRGVKSEENKIKHERFGSSANGGGGVRPPNPPFFRLQPPRSLKPAKT